MSLINDLLIELDRRGETNDSESKDLVAGLTPGRGTTRRLRLPRVVRSASPARLAIAISALSAVGAGILVLTPPYQARQSSRATATSRTEIDAAGERNASGGDLPFVSARRPGEAPHEIEREQTRLHSLGIEKRPDRTLLRVELDGRVQYRTNHDVEGRSVELRLSPLSTSDVPESFDLAGTPIRSARAKPSGDGLRIRFELESTVELRSQSLESDAGTVVVLDLLHPTANAASRVPAPARRPKPAALASGVDPGPLAFARSDSDRAREARNAHLDRAKILIGLGQHAEALEVVRAARREFVRDADLTLLEARLLEATGRLEAAIEMLAETDFTIAEAREIHALLAAYRQRAGRHASAIDGFETLLRHHPEQARWWMGLGISLEATERNPEAARAYRIALQLGELSSATRRWLTSRMTALGSEESKADASTRSSRDPASPAPSERG